MSPGCWRFCPKLQRRLLATSPTEPPPAPQAPSEGESGTSANVNQTRRQLVRDWLLRPNFKVKKGKRDSRLLVTGSLESSTGNEIGLEQ